MKTLFATVLITLTLTNAAFANSYQKLLACESGQVVLDEVTTPENTKFYQIVVHGRSYAEYINLAFLRPASSGGHIQGQFYNDRETLVIYAGGPVSIERKDQTLTVKYVANNDFYRSYNYSFYGCH